MQVNIYFTQFLKQDMMSVGGGGIGTLISYLCPLLDELGYLVSIYQCSDQPFEAKYGKAKVIGIPMKPGSGSSNEKVVQYFRQVADRKSGAGEKIEIFAADFFSVKNNNPLAITINNGLAWDAPIEILTPYKLYHTAIGEKVFRYRCQMRGLRRFETCFNRVAVDLYFLNWYRSFRGPRMEGKVWYNPNPAPETEWISERESTRSSDNPLKIIMARRLVPEKGTRLITDVLVDLLKIRPNMHITLAGEGRDLEYLKNAFLNDSRITFTSYRTEDSVKVHKEHDIAVIPSVCGEATCLAVLEAMSAGCAVIATNMGGTITEIINGFNGILCNPDKESLLGGFLRLIDSEKDRLLFQKRGWETSQRAFGIRRWRERWKNILEEIVNEKSIARKVMGV